jgi:hypothetical protein
MRTTTLQIATSIAVCMLTILGNPQPAAAGLDAAAQAYLAANPGGQLLATNEISYDNGKFIVAVTPPRTTQAAPDCPYNWFCFYDGPDFNYPRGRLSDCGWQNLATWKWDYRIESVHYNMPRGSVLYLNDSSGLFQVGVGNQTMNSVRPNQNRANWVYRNCG